LEIAFTVKKIDVNAYKHRDLIGFFQNQK